jgi:hypothetical protein
MLPQSPPHDIPRHFVIGILQVNKDHMHVFFLLPTSLHKLSYQVAFIVDLPGIKLNWFSVTLVTPLKRCSVILSHSFIVWLISLILP